MPPSPRALLFGSDRERPTPSLRLALPPALFAVVFAAYATGLFSISGGVVFVPFEAAALGAAAAAGLAVRRDGLLASWVTVYAALLGYGAEHSFLGLSGRSLAERAAAFLSPDGLVFLGVEAVLFGTIGWIAGALAALAVDRVRGRRAPGSTPGE